MMKFKRRPKRNKTQIDFILMAVNPISSTLKSMLIDSSKN